ncbi:tetratricopeptide repeat protein [Achromobacter xylosoxidans]|uniref:tetratricopeptide repeat protein n=1 Tax=Alcaligenes xylosoxydans xylosoxydans TaxID=85698 RepID=UPI003EDED770
MTNEQINFTELGEALGAISPLKMQKALAGKSGAGVWLVDAQLPTWSGVGVLKLEQVDALIGRESEALRHSAAVEHNPSFADSHIAKLVRSVTLDGYTVALFEAAGGGLENCRALRVMQYSMHKSACSNIAEALLKNWNKDAIEHQETWSESRILQEWLGYRLDKAQGGRLEDRVGCFGISSEDKAFSYAGTSYPNPMYWARNNNLYHNGGLRPILGFLHNDLHSDNALILQGFGPKSDFLLIDFALAEGGRPLLYDQAYLEFSTLLQCSQSTDVLPWIQEIQKVCKVNGPQDIHTLDIDRLRIPVIDSIGAIRVACKSWASNSFNARKGQIHRQGLLARVAVGLNYLNKGGVDSHTQLVSLLYASANLREYFEYCGINPPDPSCVLAEREVVAGVPVTVVREACAFLDSFQPNRNHYVLLNALSPDGYIGSDLTPLAQVHWSIVLDLEKAATGNTFHEGTSHAFEKSTLVRVIVPNQSLQIEASIRSTSWIKCLGSELIAGSVAPDYASWRLRRIQHLRTVLSDIFQKIGPLPIRLVVMHGAGQENYASDVAEALFQVAPVEDVKCLWIGSPYSGHLPVDAIKLVEGSPVTFLLKGIELALGDGDRGTQLRLPKRVQGQDVVSLENMMDSRVVPIINEDLEVVHAGLAETPGSIASGDFLRGAPITWAELELEQDLVRELNDDVIQNIREALSDPRNRLFEIMHKPGAGGSTFARRLIWQLKEAFPSTVLRRLSDNTGSRIESLFHLCSLPVLILIEADVCTKEEVSRLLHAASARNVRCCAIFVSRLTGAAPSFVIDKGRIYLSDVMPASEAKKFFGRYVMGASQAQGDTLRALTYDNSQQKFRSPFFYGLYRFEDGFSHVPEYVNGHLASQNDYQRELLAFASMVSVFTQAGLSERLLAAIADEKYYPGQMLGRIFGSDADRLFVCYEKDGFVVRASHPIIGRQILEAVVGHVCGGHNWNHQISAVALKFIDAVAPHVHSFGSEVIELLMQLFIQREHLGEHVKKAPFSALLIEVAVEPYQAEIFDRLTTALPDEPHFWNHYGRHCMYAKNPKLDAAVEYLEEAVRLQPDDELHHHTLGMIYRAKVREMLSQFARRSGSEIDAWTAVEKDYFCARACFEKARGLSGGGNQYPYISDIQMVTRTISLLRSISTAPTWLDFLKTETPIVEVLRNELASASGLLVEVKRLTEETADQPAYVESMEFYVQRIERDSAALIEYLSNRLSQAGGDTLLNRRFLLSVQQQRQKKEGRISNPQELERYLIIAEKNLQESNPSDQDYRHWFELYRDSSYFDITEAIAQCYRWHQDTASLDSAFLLYALYFTQWYDGAIRDVEVVLSNLERCVALSQERNRRPSIEFLTATTPAGIVSVDRLGARDPKTGFFNRTEGLVVVEGIIKEIKGPQAGTISVVPKWFKAGADTASGTRTVPAFFVPGEDFLPAADENNLVCFYLGFRRGGLRAHEVKRRK